MLWADLDLLQLRPELDNEDAQHGHTQHVGFAQDSTVGGPTKLKAPPYRNARTRTVPNLRPPRS